MTDHEDNPYYKPRKEDGTPENLIAALSARMAEIEANAAMSERMAALEAKVALIEKVVGGFGPPPSPDSP